MLHLNDFQHVKQHTVARVQLMTVIISSMDVLSSIPKLSSKCPPFSASLDFLITASIPFFQFFFQTDVNLTCGCVQQFCTQGTALFAEVPLPISFGSCPEQLCIFLTCDSEIFPIFNHPSNASPTVATFRTYVVNDTSFWISWTSLAWFSTSSASTTVLSCATGVIDFHTSRSYMNMFAGIQLHKMVMTCACELVHTNPACQVHKLTAPCLWSLCNCVDCTWCGL